MASIVKDNEIYDYLNDCFTDLEQNFKTNLRIITEYKMALDSFRRGKKRMHSKFFKERDFIVKAPTNRKGYDSRSNYLGAGYWGYQISNFLNVLDFGPFYYLSQLSTENLSYQKKRGQRSRMN